MPVPYKTRVFIILYFKSGTRQSGTRFVNSKLVFTKSNFCDSIAKLQNLNAQKWIS
jgi:hypothetical protein